jgi:hypothetical protein
MITRLFPEARQSEVSAQLTNTKDGGGGGKARLRLRTGLQGAAILRSVVDLVRGDPYL